MSDDLDNPKWGEAGRVQDWRNHVLAEDKAAWGALSWEVRATIYRYAQHLADQEEWD